MKAFISHSYRNSNSYLLENLYKQLENFKIEIVNNRYSYIGNEDITGELLSYIRKCDVFISIIDSSIPEVFLELGYAIGLGKPIILISYDEIEFPAHLKNYLYIRWDNDNIVVEIMRYMERLNKGTLTDKQGDDFLESDVNQVIDKLYWVPESLQNIDGKQFEEVIFKWFIKKGFRVERIGSKDYGYDFIIQTPSRGEVLVDVKKFAPNNNITVMKVQQLLGAVHAYHADGGLIITSSGYTSSARDFAYKCSPRIELLSIGDLVLGNLIEIYS
ncbi:restriction endonuclease [Paenibacillus lutrae]|uniref:Restriction endonuclease type IV Mrr domain-containing protein n=1 Tax=Paenibacillus lutrae TaxID=2078573 RepID=A0A7X3FJ47_9BACL|nr:restriction endonuclease [Paenibacillus lutrae]MVP00721.1 hypothetical protein [Paenibacillus lutrae]